MKLIDRRDLPACYREMMLTESHHPHLIWEDHAGVIRWLENPVINSMVDRIGLNDTIDLLHHMGYDKNSEVYRKLYRGMGYSLSRYDDVFYWAANNEYADEYVPMVRTRFKPKLTLKKMLQQTYHLFAFTPNKTICDRWDEIAMGCFAWGNLAIVIYALTKIIS